MMKTKSLRVNLVGGVAQVVVEELLGDIQVTGFVEEGAYVHFKSLFGCGWATNGQHCKGGGWYVDWRCEKTPSVTVRGVFGILGLRWSETCLVGGAW